MRLTDPAAGQPVNSVGSLPSGAATGKTVKPRRHRDREYRASLRGRKSGGEEIEAQRHRREHSEPCSEEEV
jgi:hypothetical protein